MSKFAVLAPPYPGHVNPMMALAEALAARGHTVTFFHLGDIGTPPTGGSAVRLEPAASARWTDPGAVVPGVRVTLARTGQLAGALPDALRLARIDAVIGDQLDPGAGLSAASVGLPWVSVACALLVNRERGVPPPFTSWDYGDSRVGLHRNDAGWCVHDTLMAPLSRAIARWALAHGLTLRTLDDCLSPFAQISQTVAGFDFPRRERPAILHYVGPIRGPHDTGETPPLDGRRLAFASLGTLQGHRAPIFRRIAEAAFALDLQLVIAHGGRLAAADATGLAGNPVVRDFVAQRRILERASVLVGHGGMNTVMDAIAEGVPVVAIPLAYEQAAIGARLTRSGAGLAVSHRRLTARRLAGAMRAALDDPSYRQAAQRLRAEILVAGGVQRAADIAEQVARSGRPVDRTSSGGDDDHREAFSARSA